MCCSSRSTIWSRSRLLASTRPRSSCRDVPLWEVVVDAADATSASPAPRYARAGHQRGGGDPALVFFEAGCVQCACASVPCPERAVRMHAACSLTASPEPARTSRGATLACISSRRPFATRSSLERVLANPGQHSCPEKRPPRCDVRGLPRRRPDALRRYETDARAHASANPVGRSQADLARPTLRRYRGMIFRKLCPVPAIHTRSNAIPCLPRPRRMTDGRPPSSRGAGPRGPYGYSLALLCGPTPICRQPGLPRDRHGADDFSRALLALRLAAREVPLARDRRRVPRPLHRLGRGELVP